MGFIGFVGSGVYIGFVGFVEFIGSGGYSLSVS